VRLPGANGGSGPECKVLLYFSIAMVGVLFLLLSIILGEVFDFLGGDGADGDVHPLSGKIIAVALTAFGTAGMVTSYYDWSVGLSALVSTLSALFLGACAWWLINALQSQTASTDFIVSSTAGRIGEVTVGIPEGSVGEVLVSTNTGTRQLIARSRDGRMIPPGTSVRIAEARGSMIIVERLDQQSVASAQAEEVEG
jgi:membrane-bound ClpP family serine protease